MRYIFLLLAFVITASASAQVQYLGSPTTTVRNRGNFVSDSLFYLPKRLKAPSDTGAVRYAIADSTVYVWTGYQWRNVGVSSGIYVPYTGATQDVDLGTFSLNAKSLHIKGTAGQGHLGLKHQSNTPSLSASESGIYANTNGDLAWHNDNLYSATFKTSNITAARTYTFQNKSYVVGDSADIAAKVNISDTSSMLSPYTRGSGTTNYVPKFTGTRTLGNSLIYDDGSKLSIGTTSMLAKLTVQHNAADIITATNTETTGATQNGSIRIATYDGSAVSVGSYFVETANSWSSLNYLGGYNNTTVIEATKAGGIGLIAANASGAIKFYTGGENQASERMRLTSAGELLIGTTTDAGAYALQVAGAIYNTTTLTTGAPTSGTAKPWRLGEAATVSPTSPNRTIRVEIDGTVYYIHAKTTND